MHSKHNTTNDAARVFRVILDEHRTGLARLLTTVFKDCCSKCGLPSFVEIESLPEIEAFRLSQEIGLACGFWLARKATAQQICDDFEGQFEMRRLSSDAYFLILKNTLVSDDLFYENAGDIDPVLSRDKERICSLCGKPYILLHKGFIKFKGGNRIKPKTIYETSLKFGQAFLKYPYYFCDEEAADALRKISRSFRFVESTVKFSVDAV